MLIPDRSPWEVLEGANDNCHAVLWAEVKGKNWNWARHPEMSEAARLAFDIALISSC